MARVHIIGTGGTIVSRGSDGGGAVAASGVESLLGSLAEDIDVTSDDVFTEGSYRLTLGHLRRVAEAACAAAADPDVDGVVVTHGTDTMEETAFLTDLVNDTGTTVVFTGAQRSADHADSDGPRNLRTSVALAADPRFAGFGALIGFDGSARTARGARKVHTLASQAFDGGTVVAEHGEDWIPVGRSSPPVRLPLPSASLDRTRVDVLLIHVGSSPALLRAAVDDGAHGLVLAGTGAGNAGPGYAEAVAALTEAGVPVVLATRVAHGPVVGLYGNGGGVDILAAGAVSAGTLTAIQARILAACLLAKRPSVPEFTDRFAALR